MKPFLAFIFVFLALHSTAQTPFEGKIAYRFAAENASYSGKLTFFFSKPGLRLELSEANRRIEEREAVIINFDSGKIFTLSPETKTYKVKKLKKKMHLDSFPPKAVAGFKTTVESVEYGELSGGLGSALSSCILYVADSLVYPFPNEYAAHPELWVLRKDRIVLSADFFPPDYSDEQWILDNKIEQGKERKKTFTINADTVIRQKIDAALFSVPMDYQRNEYRYPPVRDSVDSVVAVTKEAVDSTVAEAQKVIPGKKKKSPAKQKTLSKQSAIRRKE